MNFKGFAALALALGLSFTPAWADIYIRNKPITRSVERGLLLYVGRADLGRYFSKEELGRCSFDPATGTICVDGKPLEQIMLSEDGEMIPLISLAEALGFQKKVNHELGVTDSLLALKLTDDELAGVLAHEVGHGCRKDLEEAKYNKQALDRHENNARRLDRKMTSLKNKKQQLLEKAQHALKLAQVTSGAESTSYRNEANNYASQAQALDRSIRKLEREFEASVKGYRDKKIALTDDVLQRKDEYDADIKGIYYATRAGFSSTGLMDSLQKMTRHDVERFGSAAYQGGVTHPPVSERIKTMNKVLTDWRSGR